jgi:transposase
MQINHKIQNIERVTLMNYQHRNTNDNLNQLTPETLIIGIDVSKITHVARATDFRGVELSKTLSFNSNIKGFRSLLDWIRQTSIVNKKTNVIVGMEPTGPYGHTLAQFLRQCGVRAVLVLGKQVHTAKELDDNAPSQNDAKDALIIAKLVGGGRFRKLRELDGPVSSLKEAMSYHLQLAKNITRVKCQTDNWIVRYFPEHAIVFKDWTKKTAYATLKSFPLPSDINKLHTNDIVAAWRKNNVLRGIGTKKALELKHYARNSTGLTSASEFAGIHIRGLVSQYDLLMQESDGLWSNIEGLLEGVPLYGVIMGIPHMGKKAACGIAAEIGSVSDFSHPRQLIRLAGLSLTGASSGRKRGASQISKRGRPHLRRWLYLAVLGLLKEKEPSFWALHQYYTKREDNPLKPMQSVIALCGKLLRVVFGMAAKGLPYDPSLVTAGTPPTDAA